MTAVVVAIVGLVLLAVVSITLASVEAAFYLVKRRRLSHLEQNPRADLVNRYLGDPQTLLMPIHMGTYTAHVVMTVVITMLLTEREHVHPWALAGAVGFMILYLLLFRLTLPYSLVWRNPERMLLRLAPVFDVYARALRPLASALRRRAAAPAADEAETNGGAPGPEMPPAPVHDENEGRLVDAVARFGLTQVRDVMTPRPDIVALASTSTIGDLRQIFRETKYSRVPVYNENLDDIVGVVSVRDLVEYEGMPEDPLKPLVRDAFLVPETKKVAELLKEFQARRITFALAIDEYGGISGLATVEDIVEEIVGEIKDEYDLEAEPISIEADGAILVAGRVNVDRLEQALEASVADGDVGTVGGLVASVFGRIPRPGEKMEHRGFLVEVVDAERKRVHRVRFRKLPDPDEE